MTLPTPTRRAPSGPCATRHRPGRATISEIGGVARARCRCCGLKLMRLALSRSWIIADEIGGR